MAEVGLLAFARFALDVAEKVLPSYRSKFSKRTFRQPQLLAVLCLMGYEDRTFRETEIRLSEHMELRQVLQLHQVPDHTTVYRFMKRLDAQIIQQALCEAARLILDDQPSGHAVFAVLTVLIIGAATPYRIRIEEAALSSAFGEEYSEYAQRTWRLFPGW